MNAFVKFVGEKLDGKSYTHNGISGRILYAEYQAIFPYRTTVQHIVHEADEAGQQTIEYQEAKRLLGDEWDTELTDSDELVNIALACGITTDEMLAIM